MQPGYLQGHRGGTCPAREQQGNTHGAVAPAHHTGAAPRGMDYPAYGIQHAAFASADPWAHQSANRSAPRPQLYTQSTQNPLALHHGRPLQPSSQIPQYLGSVPTESMCSLQNRRLHQMGHNANGGINSAEHSGHFVKTANRQPDRQSVVHFGGQSSAYNGQFMSHPREESHVSHNVELEGTQYLNPAMSMSCSSAVPQGVPLNAAAEVTFPVREQRSLVPYSLLQTARAGGCNSSVQTGCASPASEETHLGRHRPEVTRTESQRGRLAVSAVNRRQPTANMLTQTSVQNKHCRLAASVMLSEGHSSPGVSHEQHGPPHSLHPVSQPSTDRALPVRKHKLLTDDEIQALIATRVEHFRAILQSKGDESQPNCRGERTFRSCEGEAPVCPPNRWDSRTAAPKAVTAASPPATSRPLIGERGAMERQGLGRTSRERPVTVEWKGDEEAGSKEDEANVSSTLNVQSKDIHAGSPPEKPSTGTPDSALENAHDAHKSECMSASLDFDLPAKKQLDVTSSHDGDGFINVKDGSEDKTCDVSDDGNCNSKQCEQTLTCGFSTIPILHYTLIALKELVASLGNVGTLPELKDNIIDVIVQRYWNGSTDNIRVFTSTEYPQIMMNVAAICTKEEDESPVVIAAVSGMTLDELIERHPGLTLNCGSSQEKYESLWLNVNKNLDDIDKEPGISWALRFIPEQNEEGGRGLKATETVEVRNDVGVNTEPQLVKMETVVEEPPIDALFPIKVSVLPAEEARRVFYMNQSDTDTQTKVQRNGKERENCPQRDVKAAPQSKRALPHSEKQLQNPASLLANRGKGRHYPKNLHEAQFEDGRKHSVSVCSQTDLSMVCSISKHQEQEPPCNLKEGPRSLAHFKTPECEGVSEGESPPVEKGAVGSWLPRNKTEGSSLLRRREATMYEDITDDECPPNEDTTRTSAPPSGRHGDESPPGNEARGNERAPVEAKKDVDSGWEPTETQQGVGRPDEGIAAQSCFCPCAVDTEDGLRKYKLCPNCEQETNGGILHIPTSPYKRLDGSFSLSLVPILGSLSAPLSDKRASSNQEDRVDVRKGPASQLVAESQHKAATEEVTSCNGVVTKSDCPQYQKVTPHQEPHHEELMEDESPQEKHLMRKDGEEKGGNGDRSGTRSEPPCSAAKPAPAGTASPLDVSETLSSFPEAKTTRGDDRVLTPAEADAFKSKDQVGMPKTSVGSAPSLESESEREPSTPQSRRRSSTFETEDSADYSDSSPKFNFLTVSSQSWDRRRRRQNSQRARARPRSDSEKEVCKIVTGESEDDECTRKVKKSRKRGLPTTSESEGDSDESGYVGNKAGLVHIRRKTKRQNIAKRKLTSSDSDVKAESDQCRKKERKGLSSNGSEETDNSSAPQKRPSPVPMKEHCEHDSKRPQQTRMSSGVEMENNAEDATVLQHHPVDREGKSVSALNHMVPRLIGQTSLDPADPLKLPKENTLHKHREAGTRVSKAEIKTGQEKDSSREKLVLQSLRDEGRRSVSPGEEAADSKAQQKMKKSKDEAQATLRKRTPTLREHLPSAQKGQLISGGSQASTIETLKSAEGSASVTGCPSKCSDGAASSTKRLSHSKQGSASSRKHSSHSRDESACPRERSLQSGGEAAVSRKNASESKRGSSNSSEGSSSSRVHLSSSSKNPSGERSSTSTTTMTSARKQVTSQWLACHVPTRVYRRPSLGMDEDSGTSPTRIRSERGREHRDARGEVGPGPRVNDSQPRQRHNSYESARPLMKRSMDEAKQWMMATHREAPHEQRTPVGEGYKWAEKSPTLSKNRSLNSQRRYNRSLSSPFR